LSGFRFIGNRWLSSWRLPLGRFTNRLGSNQVLPFNNYSVLNDISRNHRCPPTVLLEEMDRKSGFSAIFALVAVCLSGQTPAERPKFEVISIKRSSGADTRSTFRPSANGITGTYVVPALLISVAYGVQGFEIAGAPPWINSDRYDVIAKSAAPISVAERAAMIQALLEDRFQLKLHRETREAKVAVLVLANPGSKLPPFHEGDCVPPDPSRPPAQPKPGEKPTCGQFRSGMNGTNMTWDVVGTTIPALVRNLSAMLGRTIIDQTGVTEPVGALHLEFVPPRFEDSLDAPGPSIFNALQEQAGLKLQSGTAPVQMLVVDHIERPSEN